MKNDDFLHVMPLDIEDVPSDLLPREESSIQIVEPRSKQTCRKVGLGEVVTDSGINFGSWQTVVITLGAFLTIYLIVCEMNKRR